MLIPIYQIDAFTRRPFSGNPAAVCLLDSWLDGDLMQKIAQENNLAETAFVVGQGKEYGIRWFSPKMEIDLCGHATLAAAHALFLDGCTDEDSVIFNYPGGKLVVTREQDDSLTMQFPAWPARPCTAPALLEVALGINAEEILAARDYLVVLKSEAQLTALRPNMSLLAQIETCLGTIVTAPGESVDFVSRFFAPNAGIPEDSVTGSAHCTLIPYWAERLGKKKMVARQLSARGGTIGCDLLQNSVLINGHAALFLKGEIRL